MTSSKMFSSKSMLNKSFTSSDTNLRLLTSPVYNKPKVNDYLGKINFKDSLGSS